MAMTLRAAVAGALIALLFMKTGRLFEAAVVFAAATGAGILLDVVVRGERRKPGQKGRIGDGRRYI
jgi:hypothetical protein